MNGRETSAAAALFFSLLSIVLLLKLDELAGTGAGIGGAAVCALIAAFMMKKTIMQAALEAEDNHQRLEVQFQQLRSKLSGEQIDLLEKQTRLLENMTKKLSGLENLNRDEPDNEELKTLLESLVESHKYITLELEKIPARLDNQTEQSHENVESLVKEIQAVSDKFTILAEQNEKLLEKLEGLHSIVATGVKIVQVMGQLMKNPPGTKDLVHMAEVSDRINEKLEKLETLDNVEKIHETIVENSKSVDEVLEGVSKNMASMSTQFNKSLTEFGEQLKGLAAETEKLVERIDAYNGLTKATLDQYSMLTEQDVRVLEELTRKMEVRS